MTNKLFLIPGIFLLIIVSGFIYYYFQTSAAISNNNITLSSLQSDIAAYKSQIDSLEERLSSSTSEAADLQARVMSLQNQFLSVNSQIIPLQNENADYRAQIDSLNEQLSTYGSEATELEAQVASLQSQLSSANSQVSSLQSQNSDLTSILNLSRASIKADQVIINQSPDESSLIVTFDADYAGYLVIFGTSTTTNGYIKVKDTFSGYPYNDTEYLFGTGTTMKIPVLPGTVSVYFGNSNVLYDAAATITVTYYY
ncbi:MAG: hypothetical protein PHF74_08060 [Dehalococcoidales bacterium]|nr:hypothetical protein [Dehalococcoidales bacterium]